MRVLLFSLLFGLTAPACAQSARPWPEADRLFDRGKTWIGADGAYSVPLPGDRVLWLFGDTLVDPGHRGRLDHTRMVSNSLGLQSGLDPVRAQMRFVFGRKRDGSPAAWFPDARSYRLWPGGAIVVGDRMLLFLVRVVSQKGGLGFRVRGIEPALVDGLDLEPEKWRVTRLPALDVPMHVTLGSAGLVRDRGYLYAYGAREPGGAPVYLARWVEAEAMSGRLDRPQWWTAQGWSPQGQPLAVLPDAGTEFTVHFDAARGKFLQVQTRGFGATDLILREAPAPEGPWSEPVVLLRPPTDDWWIYQGKAHPWLAGAPLAATYSTTAPNLKKLLSDPARYRPHFVRIDFPAQP